ncbi:MAG: small subunit ribosomal protein [Patescibacteria group bacterium]|nr:small subunit ribosomal protein [Patescibacteria group bacterium]
MTHVVNPFSHRLGILRDWRSRWYVGDIGGKEYATALRGDVLLREFLNKKLRGMYVGDTIIERSKDNFKIAIHTSRPGMIIGRAGDGVERLRKDIVKEIRRKKLSIPENFKLDIVEVSSPESNAAIVGYMIAEALEKRLPFRRVLKTTAEKVMANRDVQGIRIGLAGRLGGAEMARREEIRKGNVPLQTLRADVDFAKERANMTYGVIGIKVWIYRGMKFGGITDNQPQSSDRRYDRAPRMDRRDGGNRRPRTSRYSRDGAADGGRPRAPRPQSTFTRTTKTAEAAK